MVTTLTLSLGANMALFSKLWDDIPYTNANNDTGSLASPTTGEALVIRLDHEPGYVAQTYTGGSSRKIAFYPNQVAIADGEVCCKFGKAQQTPGATITGWGVVMRASGNASSLNCYVATRYGNSLRLAKYLSGTATELTTDLNKGESFWNSDHFIKLRCNGTTIQAKAWAAGTPEPATWDQTATDNSLSIGQTGIWSFLSPLNIKFGQLHWSTAGEALPPMEFVISGNVFEAGTPNVPLVRKVRVVRRANGGRIFKEIESLSDGTFSVIVPSSDPYTVYVLDDISGSYNALIADRIAPLPLI